MSSQLKVLLYDDDTVGIDTEGGICLFTPKTAIEIAQSLMQVAKEADPTLDVEAICKKYRETHVPVGATLN